MFLLQAGADKEPAVNDASIRLGFRDSELALTNPRFRKKTKLVRHAGLSCVGFPCHLPKTLNPCVVFQAGVQPSGVAKLQAPKRQPHMSYRLNSLEGIV